MLYTESQVRLNNATPVPCGAHDKIQQSAIPVGPVQPSQLVC